MSPLAFLAERYLPLAAGPVLQLPGQRAGPCRVSVLSTGWPGQRPARRTAPSAPAEAARGLSLCLPGAMAQGTPLHLCMPALSAQARAFHLPVAEVAVCAGPPGIRSIVIAVVASGGWCLFQISLFLPFSLCRTF